MIDSLLVLSHCQLVHKAHDRQQASRAAQLPYMLDSYILEESKECQTCGRRPDKLGLEAATVATYLDDETYVVWRVQQCFDLCDPAVQDDVVHEQCEE